VVARATGLQAARLEVLGGVGCIGELGRSVAPWAPAISQATPNMRARYVGHAGEGSGWVAGWAVAVGGAVVG
jgi:hypothetical protein